MVSNLPSFLFKDDVCNVLKGGVKERQLVNEMLGSLVTESLAVWAARARHLFSVAAMPAFSVASRPSVLYAFDLIELNGDDPQRDPLEVQQGHACERAEQRESLWNSDAPHGWVLLVGDD